METLYTDIAITHTADRERQTIHSGILVDPSSRYTSISADILDRLRVKREAKKIELVAADEQQFARDVGFVIIYLLGHFTVDEVVFAEPGDPEVLGSRSLEGLNISVDSRTNTLFEAGSVRASGAFHLEPCSLFGEGSRRAADTLKQYRRIIRDLIREYAEFEPSVGEIRTEAVFDPWNDHYELVHTGWIGHERVHGSVIHIDIRDGKVWIEHNGTEDPIATRLVEAGIPREKVVLGFKPPEARAATGFATA